MNADAGPGVAVHGDASAKLPILPLVAVGLLVVGAATGFIGGWLIVRWIRTDGRRTPPETEQSQRTATAVSVAAQTREDVNA
jgi:hypothetical protein